VRGKRKEPLRESLGDVYMRPVFWADDGKAVRAIDRSSNLVMGDIVWGLEVNVEQSVLK
jgi:hypothetical protein